MNAEIEEDELTMDKRKKLLVGMVAKAGLTAVEYTKAGSRHAVIVRAVNGRERKFDISNGSHSDSRGDSNKAAEICRFARENDGPAPADPPPAPAAPANPSVARPSVPPRPSIVPRAAEVRAALAPITTPPPAAAPAASTPKEKPVMVTPKSPTSIKLTRPQFHKLTIWLMAADTTKATSMQGLADLAGNALGFKVPHSTMKEAADILELKLYQRPAKPLSDASVVARSLTEFMKAFGHPVPEDLAAVAAKATAA